MTNDHGGLPTGSLVVPEKSVQSFFNCASDEDFKALAQALHEALSLVLRLLARVRKRFEPIPLVADCNKLEELAYPHSSFAPGAQ
jgi:hypothetical protein